MKLKIYQVDAFTSRLFSGNPAAVVPLGKWLKTRVMQDIAMENNLSETAFYVKKAGKYYIRWFTPKIEVDLCGHATLAAAHVIFFCEGYAKQQVVLNSRSGILKVTKEGGFLTMDFPADVFKRVKIDAKLKACFNIPPVEAYKGRTDHMLVFSGEQQIRNLKPDLVKIKETTGRGIIVTAPGGKSDFVSRFFAPACGVDEDPVTGSAHTTLTPYWSKKLNKARLTAVQLSRRGGFLKCVDRGSRVEISGRAVLFMTGEIEV